MIGFILRSIKRQLSIGHLKYLIKLYLAYIGVYYTIVEVLRLISDANKEWTEFNAIVNYVTVDYVLLIVFILLLLSIVFGWKRGSVYILKTGQKIIFDYCPLMKRKGDIVVEVPNSFTTDSSLIKNKCDYKKFLNDYRSINKTEDLFHLIKKSLKSLEFKPQVQINTHKDQERHSLGSYAIIEFNKHRYILAAAYLTDTNHQNKTTVCDYNVFLCNLWANLSKHDGEREKLYIPILGHHGSPYDTKIAQDKKMYQILKTYIYNAKKNSSCAKELYICFTDNEDKDVDFEMFVTIAKYIDEFRTEEYYDKEPMGEGLGI